MSSSVYSLGVLTLVPKADFGLITLLSQDSTGGLEVEDQNVAGKFHPVMTEAGVMICNVGDSLSRWTNNHLRVSTELVTTHSR